MLFGCSYIGQNAKSVEKRYAKAPLPKYAVAIWHYDRKLVLDIVKQENFRSDYEDTFYAVFVASITRHLQRANLEAL